jgi:1,4-alpha-glucan branching enzyme
LGRCLAALNAVYASEPALHVNDVGTEGFAWVDADNSDHSVYAFLRKGRTADDVMLAVFNATPLPRHGYRVGVDIEGVWTEVLNSDAREFGGSGVGNGGRVSSRSEGWHGRRACLELSLPPLGALFLKPQR